MAISMGEEKVGGALIYTPTPVAGLSVAGGNTGSTSKILDGLQVVYKTNEAMVKSIGDISKQFEVAIDRLTTLGGLTLNPEQISKIVTQSVKASMDELGISESKGDLDRMPGDRRRGEVSRAEGSSVTIQSRGRVTTASEAEGDKPLTSLQAYEAGRGYFTQGGPKGGFTLSNVRKSVGTNLLNRLQNSETQGWLNRYGESVFQDADGHWRTLEVGQDGRRAVSGILDGTPEFMQYARRSRIMGAGREFARGISEGQTLRAAGLGAMPVRLAAGLGIAAGVVTAADAVGDWFEGERAANATLQRHIGGTQSELWRERNINQRLFRMGQFGMMRDDDADRLFTGVAQLGLRGDQRQAALDFGTTAYRDLGMSVQQSMQLISHAGKTGMESLVQVAEAIREVSEAALAAGTSAESARDSFTSTYVSLSNTFGGPAAMTLAGAATSASARLGMEGDTIGIDYANAGMNRVAASRMGVSLSEFDVRMQYDSDFQLSFMQQREGDIVDALRRSAFLPGGYESVMESISQGLRDNNGVLTNAAKARIVSENANAFAPKETLLNIMRLFGVTGVNGGNVYEHIVTILAGDYSPSREEAERRDRTRLREAGSPDSNRLTAEFNAMSRSEVAALSESEKERYREAMRVNPSAGIVEEINENLGLSGLNLWGSNRRSAGLVDAFADVARETGMVGGVLEAIARQGSSALGVAEYVQVQTADGPRIVTLQDAMRHYSDQLNAGADVIVAGSGRGGSVAEALNIKPQLETFDSNQGAIRGAMSQEEFANKMEDRNRPGFFQRAFGGTVYIDLSPDAKRVLSITELTGAVTTTDYAQGYGGSDAAPQTYPTGH